MKHIKKFNETKKEDKVENQEALFNAEVLVDKDEKPSFTTDVEDQEKEWLAEGELKRWVVFIDKPQFGHVLLFDNQDAFYNIPQHQVWEWDHYKNWHAGSNCGSEPYYLFHFLGKPR